MIVRETPPPPAVPDALLSDAPEELVPPGLTGEDATILDMEAVARFGGQAYRRVARERNMLACILRSITADPWAEPECMEGE